MPFGLLPNEHIAWIDAGGGPRRCGTNSTRRALDAELQAIVTNACAAEASYALAEMERLNIEALAALTGKDNVQLRTSAIPMWPSATKSPLGGRRGRVIPRTT